jgi:neutral ceramidase
MVRRVLSLAIGVSCLLVATAQGGEFRASVARVEITPAPGINLWGYSNRKGPATGTLDPLFARILVLSDGEKRLGLVTLDLGRTFDNASMDIVRTRVLKSAKIETVLFCASHTHSAPWIDDSYADGEQPSWQKTALEKIGSALEDAAGRMIPAAIGTGFGQTYIGHNRRLLNPDGTVKMLWGNATKLPTSPVDPTVGIIRIDDNHGNPIAILVNYACHPVVFGPDNLRYSADYPGAMAKTVESAFAGRPICFFLQGAPGDINPYADKTPLAENADRIMVETGVQLGQEATRVAKTIHTEVPARPSLQANLDVLRFKLRWDRDRLLASLSQLVGEVTAKRYAPLMTGPIEAPVMTVLINNEIALSGMPGEPFVDFQIGFRERSPVRSNFFIGYSNGYIAYFPTIRAAGEGGYGANTVTTRVEVGAGETMLDHSIITLYKMLGKLKDKPSE